MTLLTIEELSFAYTDQEWILDRVTLSIAEKQLIAFVGPNGGGKTTLLKLIIGLLKPTKGQLCLLGKDPSEVRTQLAYVPQGLRCDRHFPLSVLDLVLQGLLSKSPWWGGFRQKERRQALAALEQVDLAECAEQPFGALSGGQMQRALIARALVSNPKLLLLDEPTANVDKQTQNQIHVLLEELKKQCTILMVTHDLASLLPFVDRVLYVHKNVTTLAREQICQHFALGLYHPPLS